MTKWKKKNVGGEGGEGGGGASAGSGNKETNKIVHKKAV